MITRLKKKHHKVRFPVNWHAELSDRTDPLRKATSHTQANKKIKKGDLVQVETDRKMYCPVEKQYVSISSQEFSCSAHICKKPVGVSSWQVVIKKKFSKRGETFSLSSLNISSLSLTSTILHGVLNVKD